MFSHHNLNLEESTVFAERILSYFSAGPLAQLNTFRIVLNYMSDTHFTFGGCNFLINYIKTHKQAIRFAPFAGSEAAVHALKCMYNHHVQFFSKKDAFSQFELAFLMTLLLHLPDNLWDTVVKLNETLRALYLDINMERLCKYSSFTLSVFKFITKFEKQLYNLLPREHEGVTLEIPYIYMYLSVTFAQENEEKNISGIDLCLRCKYSQLIEPILADTRLLPHETRVSMRNMVLKTLKSIADVDAYYILRSFGRVINDYPNWFLPHACVLELLVHLMRNCSESIETRLEQVMKIMLIILSPKREEVKAKCRTFLITALQTMQKRFPNTSFHQ